MSEYENEGSWEEDSVLSLIASTLKPSSFEMCCKPSQTTVVGGTPAERLKCAGRDKVLARQHSRRQQRKRVVPYLAVSDSIHELAEGIVAGLTAVFSIVGLIDTWSPCSRSGALALRPTRIFTCRHSQTCQTCVSCTCKHTYWI